MGPLSYMRSVVDRNVVMRRVPVVRGMIRPDWISDQAGLDHLIEITNTSPSRADL